MSKIFLVWGQNIWSTCYVKIQIYGYHPHLIPAAPITHVLSSQPALPLCSLIPGSGMSLTSQQVLPLFQSIFSQCLKGIMPFIYPKTFNDSSNPWHIIFHSIRGVGAGHPFHFRYILTARRLNAPIRIWDQEPTSRFNSHLRLPF